MAATDKPEGVDCCGGLVRVEGRVDALEEWRDGYVTAQAATTDRLFLKLDTMSTDLTKRWPQTATIIISVLMGLLGMALGVAGTLASK